MLLLRDAFTYWELLSKKILVISYISGVHSNDWERWDWMDGAGAWLNSKLVKTCSGSLAVDGSSYSVCAES